VAVFLLYGKANPAGVKIMGLFNKSRHHQREAAMGSAMLGVLLTIASFPILFLNEGRAVNTARALKEGAASVVSVDASKIDPANNSRFVHISGYATTSETLSDPKFGVTANAIRLVRTTEMYQWKQVEQEVTRGPDGKSTKEKEYAYEEVWSAKHLDSSAFHDSENHANPPNFPFESLTTVAKRVTVGQFQLSSQLVSKITNSEPLLVDLSKVPHPLTENLKAENGAGNSAQAFYWSASPGSESPEIGDVRIRFAMSPATDVSVMAQQDAERLSPFKTHSGRELNMLSLGVVSADDMLEQAETANTMFSWALRILGIVFATVGIGLMLQPLSSMTSWIPLVGRLVEMGTSFVAMVFGPALSLLTISAAWIFYRPLVAVPLMVTSVALMWFLFSKSKRENVATSATPPPVPAG